MLRFDFTRSFSRAHSDYLRHSKPTLPEDMRRMIDEAVAAGRITHVPRGTSGLPQFRFVGTHLAAGGFMEVHIDENGREVLAPIGTAVQKAKAAKDAGRGYVIGQRASVEASKARSAARQAAIWQMHEDGLSNDEIGTTLGTTASAIAMQLKLIRRQRRDQGLDTTPAAKNPAPSRAPDQRVVALRRQGKSLRQIAADLNVSLAKVRWHCQRDEAAEGAA